jgi:hypothetical protein
MAEAAALREAKKALGHLPSFDGTTTWRTFEDRYRLWNELNLTPEVPVDFRKQSLLYCLKGTATERARPFRIGQPGYADAATLEAYVLVLRGVFQPQEESELARAEFKAQKQRKNEDIATYLMTKISLFENAFPEDQRSFATLLTEVIDGIYNPVVKRIVRRGNPEDQATLRTVAITAVANEREAYRGGYGESASLDGLACVSIPFAVIDQGEPMDVDKVGKLDVTCYRCQKKGHMRKDCRVKLKNQESGKGGAEKEGKNPRRKGKCYNCGKDGHFSRECRSPKKNDEGKKAENCQKRVKNLEEEEEDPFLDDSEGVGLIW